MSCLRTKFQWFIEYFKRQMPKIRWAVIRPFEYFKRAKRRGKWKLISSSKSKRIRRNRNKLIRDTITAMILCNNVTPIIDEEQNVTYQASSPDEVALVKFAETLNMKLNLNKIH